MKEAAFIRQNKSRWQEFEKVVKHQKEAQPDRLAELFIQVTDDLSFANTQYPGSRTTQYLNSLASKVHLEIYKNKKEETSRFVTFWKYELPEVIYNSRKSILYAFIVFIVSAIIGTVSSLYDDTFVRLILGDGYVNMTLENIKQGNPTKVYAMSDEVNMFFQIAWNNVRVALYCFVSGVFTAIASGFILFRNGVMVGAFVMLFYKEQQFLHAFPVIMLHGTIELSAIVIAGAAGFEIGNSLTFPKTYARMVSFKNGAIKGLKIAMGLLPFIVLAAAIESFITRFAFMHWGLKLLVIGLSAALMLWYFVIYPFQLKRNGKY
ncbi:MAG TPA: stage II sporulation protein M [Ohtaekwangia sp.]|nr:stage II sporulation protein M [Ohtaekwangia sp.]